MEKIQSYKEFVDETRVRTNYALNRILWYFLITGPAVALGIWGGMFKEIVFKSCIVITVVILALAFTHLMICKKNAKSKLASIFAIISLDILLVYMANSHVGIYLTYCLVPTFSLLYCDRKIFLAASIINFVAMGIGTFMVSPFFSSHSTLYPDQIDWFINYFAGYTIEAIIMFLAGSSVNKNQVSHLKKLYENAQELENRRIQISDQLDILKSMSQIYQTLNLVDLEHNEISALNELNKMEKIAISVEMRSNLNKNFLKTICYEYKEAFAAFTDLGSLRKRINGKKKITLEIQDSLLGWLRCQYISVDENNEGITNKVIYTIENVNEEKHREERLIRISNTDELTKLYNRRSYELDVKNYDIDTINNNFVIFSIDINGLKQTNDSLGHDAGDQLILGAAVCLLKVFGNKGKIYRVGGDEFVVIMQRFGDVSEFKKKLQETAAKWTGTKVKSLNFSIGYACKCNSANATFKDLEKEADKMMYQDKELFYSQRGTDRRGMQVTYSTICDSYEKILKINLADDSFKVIKLTESEKNANMGYSEKLSEWVQNFANLGFIQPDDVENFLRYTNTSFLQEYFADNNVEEKRLKIHYHRKKDDNFRNFLMEIASIPKNTNELFLYIKDIDDKN